MSLLKMIIRTTMKPAIDDAKGVIGEKKVSAKLNSLPVGEAEHRQINNLMLVDENGKSHQIDHVEIRQNGIFCIETKNYSGWIFGNESQEKWTQTLYGDRYYFLNPIKQNRSHMYHLSKALGDKYKINSVIVMVKNNADRIGISYVVNLKDLKSYLSTFDDGTRYSISEIDSIYQSLLAASRNDMTRIEHIANIRSTRESIQNEICPRCGGKLILRSGRYGNFYGCTNYPNCKFTRNL